MRVIAEPVVNVFIEIGLRPIAVAVVASGVDLVLIKALIEIERGSYDGILPEPSGLVSRLVKDLGEGHEVVRQGMLVEDSAVLAREGRGEERSDRGLRGGALRVRPIEDHRGIGEIIDPWAGGARVAVGAEMVASECVDNDNEDIGAQSGFSGVGVRGAREKHHAPHQSEAENRPRHQELSTLIKQHDCGSLFGGFSSDPIGSSPLDFIGRMEPCMERIPTGA